ncbi:hypothetical protein [Spongiactinospora gelatinilytica]|nr:hypothetical protein [Spongiactinospora gelatinilytica]
MPPPPPGDPTAKEVFDAWLAFVNRHGIADLAARCAQGRAAQVKMERARSTAVKSTWGNASCFAVVEVVKREGSGIVVAAAAGWSQSEHAAEGKVHAERSAIQQAFELLGSGILGISRVYVELAPCSTRIGRQSDSCAEWLSTIAPNATVMYSHDHPGEIDAWKKLNTEMAKEDGIYEFASNFLNAGEARVSDDGLYVAWRGGLPRAAYHTSAQYLAAKLENSPSQEVPLAAAARVDGT